MFLNLLGGRVPCKGLLFLIIPIVLATYTHFWNPLGFLDPEHDENRYMIRAMNLLEGLGPRDAKSSYDAPFFGQLFMAGILGATGYPYSSNLTLDVDELSIEILWIFPRLVMAALAVIDTFLLYKISEKRYNRHIALYASALFAVLPLSLLLQRMWLECIMLPFLLSAILFALNLKDSNKTNNHYKNIFPILLSGIFLGLSIFTKITAFTMIPLVVYLIYRNAGLKLLVLWCIPVIIIPLIWPAYALYVGEFDQWFNGVYHQTHRTGSSVIGVINENLDLDPVLIVVGSIGILYASIKRDFFLLLWTLPFAVFSFSIGWTQFFHFVLIMPAFCIAAARLVVDISNKFSNKKIRQIVPIAIISTIGIIGLVTVSAIITENFTKPYFEAEAFITNYLAGGDKNDNENGTQTNLVNRSTLISNPFYLWIPQYVFDLKHDYTDFLSVQPIKTQNVILVDDIGFREALFYNSDAGDWLRKINKTYDKKIISKFEDISILSFDVLHPSSHVTNTSLIDQNHVWKTSNYVSVLENDNGLMIRASTNDTDRTFNRAFLSTDLNFTSREPLFVTLEYLSKSGKGNATYMVEIKDSRQGRTLWNEKLDNTFGELATNTFVLPSSIANTPIEVRLYIVTQGPGEHSLTVKNFIIV